MSNKEFKVGDKIYCPQFGTSVYVLKKSVGDTNIFIIGENYVEFMAFDKKGYRQPCRAPYIFHATPENRDALQVLFPDIEFEAPPKPMRKIGEWEYPEPESEAPPKGTWVYIPDLQHFPENEGVEWYSTDYLIRCLNAGLVHLTPEAAKAHAKALILASGGRIDE